MHIPLGGDSNSDLVVNNLSNALTGLSFAICVGGGIAAIEVPKVARELRRFGASVKVFATESALQFIGRQALEWATAQDVVTQASGLAEHICVSDAVLVLPATTDLIGKAANGICPDACSTYIQSALGKQIPVFFLPTMHDSLRNSPAFMKNMSILSEFPGVSFIEPRIEEGKWKSPSPDSIALEVAYKINQSILKKQFECEPRALVTFGGTVSKVDMARTIANLSTGTLGSFIIRYLLENGIEVHALCGNHIAKIPKCSGITTTNCADYDSMKNNLKSLGNGQRFSALFHVAAISDFACQQAYSEKISSKNDDLILHFKRLPKLISEPSIQSIQYKIACKFTTDNSPTSQQKARQLLTEFNLNAVLWNWGISAFGTQTENLSILIRANTQEQTIIGKENAAAALVNDFINHLKRKK